MNLPEQLHGMELLLIYLTWLLLTVEIDGTNLEAMSFMERRSSLS